MRDSLSGLLVLDLTRLLPGPFATQVLADLGARVVKVEEPERGDYARWIPPEVDGAGFTFSAMNRGKESIAVDLRSAGGADVVRRLASRADVLVESFRPGVLERLGLAPADLVRENPRLVVLRLSGYGQGGPMKNEVGHDINYQALAGTLGLTGPAERPVVPATTVGDLAGGMYGCVAVLAALRARDATGKGAVLDVALHDAALAFNAMYLSRASAEPVRRGGLELAGALPAYDVYRCLDGEWIALGALEPKFWERFALAVERPDWVERHTDASIAPELAALFATKGRDQWAPLLARAGVPATPVLRPEEVLEDAHVRARLGVKTGPAVPGPGSPLTHRPLEGPVPALGGATDAILRELGFDAEAIARLRASGAVA